MKYVALDNLTEMQIYWLITGSIAPRAIALVTTQGQAGHVNAAPFSSFTYMSEDPPLMVLGVDNYHKGPRAADGKTSHRLGEMKDTLRNIIESREFVVNMVDEPMTEQTVLCATDFPSHMSEPEAVGFTLGQPVAIKTPHIAEAPIAWECKLYRILDFSKTRSIVFGEIVGMHFKDGLLDEERMRVRAEEYAPVGRLSGPNYCRTTDRWRINIPVFAADDKPRI
jgi:flavin reductase (DIM6/NTAB) family NADH-FMN oxidoreductase RutF